MLSIQEETKKPLDFQVMEGVFRRLAAHPDDAELRIPTNLKGWRVGGQAALIHFICHWGARLPEPRLVLYTTASEAADTQLSNLGKTQHGLVALVAVTEVMVNGTAKTAIPDEARRALVSALLKPLYPNAVLRIELKGH